MKRIALGIEYDGADWHGWQTQPGGKTVQDRLQYALSEFADQPIRVVCAGRTDTGVHALGQVVHFDFSGERAMQGWVRGVNARLPSSIAVAWAHQVDDSFHARYSASSRTYRYLLLNAAVRSPLWHRRAGWTHRPLDLAVLRSAANILIGEQDFSAFRSAECQASNPVRHLERLAIDVNGPMWQFEFRANAFLHHMIRNLMGSLLAVGSGARSLTWLAETLVARDRSKAAPTFMPDGLYLTHVAYPEIHGLPERDSGWFR